MMESGSVAWRRRGSNGVAPHFSLVKALETGHGQARESSRQKHSAEPDDFKPVSLGRVCGKRASTRSD